MTPSFLVRPAIVWLASALCVVSAQAQTRTLEFNIAAGELKPALDLYARQTGVQMLYKVEDLQGLMTAGVRGSHDEIEALRLLLASTPLSFKKDGANALVLFRAPAAAAPGHADDADTLTVLETITVTAQRRPEAAQSVPIALSSFSAATLETQRLSNLSDISRLTPGLLVSAFSVSNPTIAIRGANNTFSQMGVSKPVAVAVDDVFAPRNSAAAFELFDLENVTVLKGPQGTLFGRNVTGGAVMIQTRRPSYEKAGSEAQLSFGNLGAVSVDALTNLVLGDEKALKLSVATRDRDGTGRDRISGREQDDLRSRNARGQFRMGITGDLEALFSADYGEDGSQGRTLSSNGVGDDGDRRTSELGAVQGFDRTLWGASAKFEYSRPWGDITSITAYRHAASREDYASVGASYTLLASGSQLLTSDAERVGTFSHELRYATPAAGWGSFQAGIFLLDEDGTRQLGTRSLGAGSGAVVAATLADQAVRTRSASLFADGTWRWTPTLSLTAGGRYTRDRKTASLVRSNLLAPAQGFTEQGLTASWQEFTPRVALNWQPTDAMLLYGSVTKGFTAGGFNTEASTLAALRTPFNPETVVNRELGLKSQWLANRLRVNLSVFDMSYRDKQEFLNNTVTGILSIMNASRATVRGAELELAFKPTAWLNLAATYGQLKARYDQFQIGNINYTGNPMASSPRDKASLAADWRVPVAAGVVTGALSYGWQAAYNTGAANDPNLRIPAYGLLNFNVGLEATDRRWRVQAWVKNATDRDYILTRSTQVVRAEYLGAPRTFGVTAGLRF
jgi:iron complex outermembrane receptor protein